ncbi:MAG TPA: hypothetical protein VE644_01080 [Gaiellaceae bacterium]|jgi:hypothetical protein|nr:hypothetical protein [Gaiellaceae bacterium]
MDAASSQQLRRRGASRLLGDCAALERLAASDRPSARARLESELGHELAALLVGALAAVADRRSAWALH